ncbi:T9SS type A sorting domain-containing protein [Flavobacterium sp. NRK1]|uniref:T9SS type A sorting domain-containing protein n=1 Tax=Flavobacterium sp. NRK1 TaxID=2954929 RepID=UPI002093E4BA|nr:T9SS type A sorting domain-containing protein [Flavobacterium sp. NRK1]MCO6148759.1 T9SS type A sorting domain-containing protein [Flavobacterium sp. NRK1]
MRKKLLIGAFILATFFTSNAQQKISQNNDETTVESGGNLGCPTAPNVYSRSFVLSDFDITEDWNVTEVEFGLQDYITAGSPLTITLSTTSQAYPGGYPGSLTQLATITVSYTEAGETLNVLKQVPITAVVPAGSELVVEISGDFFIGGNTAGASGPSYLMAVGCGATTPTDVTELGDFGDVNFVINVTGSSETAGIKSNLVDKVTLFPNPTNGIVTIKAPGTINIAGATITDVAGKVSNADLNGNTVNMTNYAAGVYFLNISTDSGKITKKIVKQ